MTGDPPPSVPTHVPSAAQAGRSIEQRGDLNRLFAPRKLVLQGLGFLVGAGLLAWCIIEAAKQGDWQRVWNAQPWLIAALAGCTIVSLIVNGILFWVTLLPMRRLNLLHVQLLIIMSSLLNYTPIRAGLIARLLYHRRVDGMTWGELAAWLAAITVTMGITVTACLGASIIRPQVDVLWALIVGGGVVAGVFGSMLVVRHPLFARYGMGLQLLLGSHHVLFAALALRLIDLAAFTGRMAVAMVILGIEPPSAGHVILLAIVAMSVNLVPVARVGFREWAVASLAGFAAGKEEQLALIDSAGEAMVFIPAGIVALVWYRHMWKRAGKSPSKTPAPPT